LGRPKRTARTTINCRKSEIRLSLAHEQCCGSAWPRRRLPFRRLSTEKGLRKKIPRFTPRNQLKSHDQTIESKEIQENPTLMRGVFAPETARSQENPNGSTAARYGAEPGAKTEKSTPVPTGRTATSHLPAPTNRDGFVEQVRLSIIHKLVQDKLYVIEKCHYLHVFVSGSPTCERLP
jgi:hypothetical protein